MLNAIIRAGYRLVYRAARLWWFVRRPRTSGAVVAMWSEGRVLLVRTSYRPQYGLPGGFVSARETPAEAAARELFEELRVRADPSRLRPAWHGVKPFEHREDTISILEMEADRSAPIEANQRELVWVGWR